MPTKTGDGHIDRRFEFCDPDAKVRLYLPTDGSKGHERALSQANEMTRHKHPHPFFENFYAANVVRSGQYIVILYGKR